METRNEATCSIGSVRTLHKVKLNIEAKSLKDLIIWEEDKVSEPVLTRSLTIDQVREIVVVPMSVPNIPVHGQSMERCVKEVTSYAESVYGYDQQDGLIRARLEHRQLTGGLLKSKKDHAKIVINS